MRFSVEQMFLDPRQQGSAGAIQYYTVEAETVDAAITQFLNTHSAELVGQPQRFPGLQAIATGRANSSIFTIHLTPTSDRIPDYS